MPGKMLLKLRVGPRGLGGPIALFTIAVVTPVLGGGRPAIYAISLFHFLVALVLLGMVSRTIVLVSDTGLKIIRRYFMRQQLMVNRGDIVAIEWQPAEKPGAHLVMKIHTHDNMRHKIVLYPYSPRKVSELRALMDSWQPVGFGDGGPGSKPAARNQAQDADP